jgi:hypothetical protein
MHELITSPFLGNYVVVRPGSSSGMKIPRARYKELAQPAHGGVSPAWLVAAVWRTWDLDLSERPVAETVLVRTESSLAFGRAPTSSTSVATTTASIATSG